MIWGQIYFTNRCGSSLMLPGPVLQVRATYRTQTVYLGHGSANCRIVVGFFWSKVSLGHTCVHSFVCGLWQLSRYNSGVEQHQQWLQWLQSQKMCTNWPFAENGCWFRKSHQTHTPWSLSVCCSVPLSLFLCATHQLDDDSSLLWGWASTWPSQTPLNNIPIFLTKNLRLRQARVDSQTIT